MTLHPSQRIILAADDDQDILDVLQIAVKGLGHVFFGTPSGEACASLATRVSPHLILLDVNMPGIDGYETCRRMRGMDHLQRVPIAFITANRTAADVTRAKDVGGNDFILKPFTMEKLQDRIRHWVARRVG
jgi:CheY-like chemotaxis protein